MQDEIIVELYWQRDESALRETEIKYGSYLSKVSFNILSDKEECTGDSERNPSLRMELHATAKAQAFRHISEQNHPRPFDRQIPHKAQKKADRFSVHALS